MLFTLGEEGRVRGRGEGRREVVVTDGRGG